MGTLLAVDYKCRACQIQHAKIVTEVLSKKFMSSKN